jgi:hypothetical protein
MDDDLVKRLRRRTLPTDMGGLTVYDEDPMCHEAADRIEQLEAALETVMRSAGHTEADIRAALGEKKDD